MAFPTWSPGQVLTADDVNVWLTPKYVGKSSAQSVTSSATKVNDTELFLPVSAYGTYWLNCHLWFDGNNLAGNPNAPGGLRTRFAIPSGTTYNLNGIGNNTAGNNGGRYCEAGSDNLWYTDGNNDAISYIGTVQVSAASGDVRLQWAQVTSSSTSTTVHSSSYLMLQRTG